jgi:hypothetical protein
VVSVLATRPKGREFKPCRGDGFLTAIKIRGTSSFGWEVKPDAPCCKILRHVKRSLEQRATDEKAAKFKDIFANPCFTARCLWCKLVDK